MTKKTVWTLIVLMVVAIAVTVPGTVKMAMDQQLAQMAERKAAIEAKAKKSSDEAAADCTIANKCVGQPDPAVFAAQPPNDPVVLARYKVQESDVLTSDDQRSVQTILAGVLLFSVGLLGLAGLMYRPTRKL